MSRIEGHNELARDDSNNSIMNTDNNAYSKAKSIKDRMIRQTNEINTLRNDVQDMKEMLIKLSEKINGKNSR